MSSLWFKEISAVVWSGRVHEKKKPKILQVIND
jgi:hypothetical protein